ncbi:universal stress protein [Natrialbaceae archaeon AArc-T1-2]|uniref:universal stress protein n=1 Tax=Natrialbaceae archaeon AArc-T1-2 TaxID=3053904 RepID=UPI00255A9E80|nr:universal stress protein [Natrialbaceae archaeon AArc-T1-2]WIV68357.1 universal stress protein [Natrialbaceae archaeon AArc-T1-2]
MYDSILVPVDGTPGAEGAIARALSLARVGGATVHALSVIESGDDLAALDADEREQVRRSTERRGEQATEHVMELADDAGVEVVRHVRDGVSHRQIVAYADEADADLIVMGTHGERDVRLGSTTERVIATADVPVMAVRLADGPEDVPSVAGVTTDRVVVPTDGSDAADRATDRALEIADLTGATVDVVYVIDRTIYDLEDAPRSIIGNLREGGETVLEEVAAEATERGLGVNTEVLRGAPDEEILAYADGVDADLLAMGTRGRGGGGRSDRLLGSTTARVVRRSERPVLTVR